MQEGTEESLIPLDLLRGRACPATEFDRVVGREVGERVHLEIGPDPFHGVEFGSIRGKELGLDLPRAFPEQPPVDPLVRSETIPQQEEPSREMHTQLAKKWNQILHGDVFVRQEGKVKSQPLSLGGNGDCCNHGDLLPGTRALVKNGSRPDRSPGAPEMRRHQKPALIEKDQVDVQPLGVFFTRGHSSFTHLWISASFRSRARRSGFCGENPIDRRRRAT